MITSPFASFVSCSGRTLTVTLFTFYWLFILFWSGKPAEVSTIFYLNNNSFKKSGLHLFWVSKKIIGKHHRLSRQTWFSIYSKQLDRISVSNVLWCKYNVQTDRGVAGLQVRSDLDIRHSCICNYFKSNNRCIRDGWPYLNKIRGSQILSITMIKIGPLSFKNPFSILF